MDWFKKQKLSSWIIGLLIIINIGTLLSLWISRPRPADEVPLPPAEHEQRVMNLLRRELRLSDEQTRQFKTLRLRHFQRSLELDDDILALRKELMDSLLTEHPDTLHIRETANRLGDMYSERELANARHLYRLQSICSTGQQVRFHGLMRELIPRGRRGGTGRGRGMTNGGRGRNAAGDALRRGRGNQNQSGTRRGEIGRGAMQDSLRGR